MESFFDSTASFFSQFEFLIFKLKLGFAYVPHCLRDVYESFYIQKYASYNNVLFSSETHYLYLVSLNIAQISV